MRKVVGLMLLFVSLLVMTVPTYAFTASEHGFATSLAGGNTEMGVFKTATLTEVQKEFLRKWMSSEGSYLEFWYPSGKQPARVRFVAFAYEQTSFTLKTGYSSDAYGTDLSIKPFPNVNYIDFSINSGTYIFKAANFTDHISQEVSGSTPVSAIHSPARSPFFSRADISYSGQVSSTAYLECAGDLVLRDDGGILSGYNVTKGQMQPTAHTLTVRYAYEEGGEAASAHTATLAAGEAYSVPTPEIEGFEADMALVAGTMPGEDVAVTVTYKRREYDLTVAYDRVEGGEAAPAYTAKVLYAAPYSVPSPEVTGYEPDRAAVTGVMPASDVAEAVSYERKKYSVSVTYAYEEGGSAAPTYTKVAYYGDPYSIASPPIAGYTPDKAAVSGTIPAHDVSVTVTYKKDSPPPVGPPVDSPVDPPDPGPSGPYEVRVLDYGMFEGFFNYMRDNGGVLITYFLKAFFLCTCLYGLVRMVRGVILSAVERHDEPGPR